MEDVVGVDVVQGGEELDGVVEDLGLRKRGRMRNEGG